MTYPHPGRPQQQMPQPTPHTQGQPRYAMGITAVVFAVLAALVALAGASLAGFEVIRAVADSNPMTRFTPIKAVASALAAGAAVLLLVGAVLHARRKKAGFVVLAVGVVASIACVVPGLVAGEPVSGPIGVLAELVAAAVGLLAVVLAFRSRRWLLPKQAAYPHAAYPASPPGQYYGYEPQPGYGQQPQPPQQWR